MKQYKRSKLIYSQAPLLMYQPCTSTCYVMQYHCLPNIALPQVMIFVTIRSILNYFIDAGDQKTRHYYQMRVCRMLCVVKLRFTIPRLKQIVTNKKDTSVLNRAKTNDCQRCCNTPPGTTMHLNYIAQSNWETQAKTCNFRIFHLKCGQLSSSLFNLFQRLASVYQLVGQRVTLLRSRFSIRCGKGNFRQPEGYVWLVVLKANPGQLKD